MPDNSAVVVVGGGIAGLLAALLTRSVYPHNRLCLVEQAAEVGGLLGKVDGGKFGVFDLGMHTMTQTGLEPLDQLFWSLLPEEEWCVFEGVRRDISGTFFRGRLQRHAHYPDLRSLPESDYAACLVDLFAHLQRADRSPQAGPDMASFGQARFGPEITRRLIEPLMLRTYGRPAAEIDTLAAALLRLDRVVMFDEPLFQELMASPTLRACVAYPEQRHLDLAYSSGKGSYYPRRFGIHRVIDALLERCQRAGVEVLTSTAVRRVICQGGRVSELELSGRAQPLPVRELLWSAGVVPLAHQLGVFPRQLPSHPPLTTAVVNFLFDHPTEMDDLYYFYCLDEGYRTHRVTNFTAYCPGAPRAGGWPICVELLLLPGQDLSPQTLQQQALDELRAFGVLPEKARTLFAHARVLERGFPLPSVANMELLEASRQAIAALQLANLRLFGVLSKPGLFFQTDVVRDVYQSLLAEKPCAV
jgi:protoporphyrinogen oxidase